LNGEVKDTHEIADGGVVRPGQVARVGQDGSHYFNGSIDNVQIFNRGLSADEVQSLYTTNSVITSLESADKSVPQEYRLAQNYPNPFNPSTTIAYALKKQSKVTIVVYDLLGRKIAELVHANQNPGTYKVHWNGRDDSGVPVSSGLYLYKIEAGDFTSIKKMILVK